MRVLDFAVKTELSARDFYSTLAEKAPRKGLRAIYRGMAMDEEKILKRLQAMAEGGGKGESRALDGMENIFQTHVREEDALRFESDTEAYLYLMRIEKDLCNLYEEAARREADPAAREQLLRIAAEEEREFRVLETTYDFINAPNEYLAWREFSNLDEFHNFGRYEDNRSCGHTG
jgi:rubrerythrin